MSFLLELVDQAKREALRALGDNPQLGELVEVSWPQPTGTIYFAQMQYDELPEYEGLTLNPIEARFEERVFQQIQHGGNIADSNVSLNFVDDDGKIADLCERYGPGVKTRIFFYFPDVGWLLDRGWWGHLGSPNEVGGPITSVPATFGFRSANLSLPKRYHSICQYLYGINARDLDESSEIGCPYNIHLPGGTIGSLGLDGLPLPTCAKNSSAECARHFGGSKKFWPGFDTIIESHTVFETKGQNILATSRGNETNLKQAVGILYGELDLNNLNILAFNVEPDTKHPDKGSALVLVEVREGTMQSMSNCKVNDILIGFQHLQTRLGSIGQPATGFSPNINPYSGTAVFYAVVQGNFVGATAASFRGSCHAQGLNDIRVYSNPVTFVRTYTNKPSWCILDMLTNKRRGDGRDISTFIIQDWLDVDVWHAMVINYKDAAGTVYTGIRASFNADLGERTTQQQINDACLFTGLTPPFPFQGKTRIMPLKQEDLTDAPIFTDDYETYANNPNVRLIMFDDQGSTLRISRAKKEGELVNHIEMTFLDAANGSIQRPLTFEDEQAQLAEGKAAGDSTICYVKKEYSAMGITDLGQAVRAGWRLLYLGEFDEGGIYNNCKANFTASILDTLDLHQYKVIKIISKKLDRYKQPFVTGDEKSFQYFRIQKYPDETDLTVKLEAVAYPEDYYDSLAVAETDSGGSGDGLPGGGGAGDPNPGGGPGNLPCTVGFHSISHTYSTIEIVIAEC
jgi:hypothetical protein